VQYERESAFAVFLFKNAGDVFIRVTRVNDEWQLRLSRCCNVPAETPLLFITRAVVVVIVEAGFPNGNDLGMFRGSNEISHSHIWFFCGVVRVRANRTKHIFKPLGDSAHTRKFLDTSRDGDHASETGHTPALHHSIQFIAEVGKVEMTMTVDEHD
jgi:hypothetical protein